MHSFYSQMMDFEDQNEDFASLYNNYLHSEIYKEIKDFLDIAHPDWRKYKELGHWAPEFVLSVIGMWEDREEDEPVKDWLKNIYEDISSEYHHYHSNYLA